MIKLFFLAFILQQQERSPTLDVLHTSIINIEDFNASAQKICSMAVSIRPINWFSVVITHHDINHLEFVFILDPTQHPRDHAFIIALCQLLLLTSHNQYNIKLHIQIFSFIFLQLKKEVVVDYN